MVQPSSLVICGYDQLVAQTIEVLIEFGRTALVVDLKRPEVLPEGCQFLQADFRRRSVLEQIGIEQVRVVLLLHDGDQDNFETALLIRELNPRARIVSRLFNRTLGRYFDQAIPNHFSLSTSALVSPAFALRAVSDEFIGYFALPDLKTEGNSDLPPALPMQEKATRVEDPILSPAENSTLWNIVDLKISGTSRLLRMPLEELEDSFDVRVLFHYPVDQLADFSPYRVFEDFDYRAQLAEGDQIVVICKAERYLQLLERNGRKQSSRVQQWAAGQGSRFDQSRPRSWSTKLFTTIQTLWQKRPTLSPLNQFLTLALAVMLTLGTFNFISIGKTPADAIFLTLTVLSGGYGDIGDFQEPETPVLVKLLAILLTLIGTALVGLVYGFVTDKLVSSRFGLKKSGIPQSDHVVIAGLGRLGYRIVQLLRQMSYEVVAIEANPDSPLIKAVHQEGVEVLIGDSALPSTLAQANLPAARCLICAIPNDLSNLETALTSRSLNPMLRKIIRISDPQVAKRMQQHFRDLGISYSQATLAAPAFATAALVGSVYGTVSWDGQTLLVTLLEITSRSPYLGQSLSSLAHQYDLVILVVQPLDQPSIIFPKIAGEHKDLILGQGDRLYILGALGSLSRLARRKPFPDESYRVKLLNYTNSYFEKDIVEAIAFHSRVPAEKIRPLLKRLPAVVSPPLPREKALKLARQLKKMSTQIEVFTEVISPNEKTLLPSIISLH
ncbi:MAG: NAD-binding protein [Cyanobacteriota bacterium]|nr:NAD-binding protein [Cyanobacteriota bacterium]